MNLSSAFGVLGAAAGGYADDEKERLRREQLALANQRAEDVTNIGLAENGYFPTQPGGTRVPNAPDLRSLPGITAMPSQSGGQGAGIAPRAMGPDLDRFLGGNTQGQAMGNDVGPTVQGPAILDRMMRNPGNVGTIPPVTVHGAKGPQDYEFDYGRSKQGQEQQRQQAVRAQQDEASAKKAADVEAAKARDAAAAKAEQNRLREEVIQHRIAALRPVYPSATPEQLRGTAESDAAFVQAVKPDEKKDHYTFPVGSDASGKPVIMKGNTATGSLESTGQAGKVAAGAGGGSAPMASKEGQFGEMLKKAPDIFSAAEALDVGIGQSAARDIAEHGIGIAGMHVPGTKGVGAELLNRHPAYSQYQAALAPFVLANAHALSGARINMDQATMIKQSIERQPGDFANPNVLKQRDKNMIDQINSIAGSLPREAVARQEAQMDPEVLKSLVARGYKAVSGAVDDGKQGQRSALWKKLVAGGMDKETAKATVLRQIP